MLNKSEHYKGYILLESLVSLGMLCLIIGNYFSLNTFLLKKNQQTENQLQLHRVMYEEMKYYENHGGQDIKQVQSERSSYTLSFLKADNKLIGVEIYDGETQFLLEKK